MDTTEWKFDTPSNSGCVTTRQVMEEGYPILAVLHDEDGGWQVLCETTQNPNDGMLISLDCMYEKFPIIGEFLNIKHGYEAIRETEQSEWKIIKSDYGE